MPKGINPKAKLVKNLFAADIEMKPTRDGYGQGLVELGKTNPNVVVLCADLSESTRSHWFKKEFPDRFVQMGIFEQAMAAIASGFALAGKIPFISSYAGFSPGRNWEQIRTTAALNNANVKVAGAHAGVSVGPDGATHQMIEDIAIAAASVYGPHYLRFGREKSPVFTTPATPFQVGRAETFRFGTHVTIVACGIVVHEALKAAEELSKKGIEAEVIDCHTIKPLDVKTILASVKKTGCVVTAEEHQAHSGMGSAVCEMLASNFPVPVERIGVQNRFGESGDPFMLMDAFGLTAPYIQMAVRRVVARRDGKRVSEIPEYITAAEKRAADLKKQIISEALARTPREWGGKKGTIKDLIAEKKKKA